MSSLKTELGLGEPQATGGAPDGAPQGSTKQRDEFKAAFQSASATINKALQYTAAYAEKAKHDPHAASRDKTCQAYQVALGKIDPTNPSAAQGAIDQVISAVQKLGSTAEALQQTVEKAYTAWTGKEPSFEGLQNKVREMVEWGHKKAEALTKVCETVAKQANERKYEEAVCSVGQVETKIDPIYQEYQRQKAAQEQYEPTRAALDPKLADASKCTFASLAEMDQAIADLTGQIDAAVAEKDYVRALELLTQLTERVEAKLARAAELEAKKAEYEQARAALDPRLAEASTSQFPALRDLDQSLADLTGLTDAAVAAEDYEQAVTLVGELTAKVDDKLKRVAEIEAAKAEYEQARAALDPKLNEASTSLAYHGLEELDQAIADLTSQTDAAAAEQDFVKALELVKQLSEKVEEKLAKVAEIEAAREQYEQRLAALQGRLTDASVSEERLAYLQPIVAELATIQSEMEAAAAAQDWLLAIDFLDRLESKLDERDAAIEAKKQEYEAAKSAALSKVGDCMVSARDFSSLAASRTALTAKQKEMEAAGAAEDYAKGIDLAKELEGLADKYLADAATEQEQYDKKGEEVNKALDDANYFTRDDVAREWADKLKKNPDQLKHLPTEVRNRLMEELQSGVFSDDDKKAMKDLFSQEYLDPEFEKINKVNQDKMIETLKNDPAFKDARARWNDPSMTDAEKLAVLQKAADLQGQAYGFSPGTIEGYDRSKPGNEKKPKYGAYNHDDGKLQVNTEQKVLTGEGFDEAMDTAVHENLHRYQCLLIDRLEGKAQPPLKKGDPLYNQAMTFKLNDPKRGYYVFTGPEYSKQPQEHHSRLSHDVIKNSNIGK